MTGGYVCDISDFGLIRIAGASARAFATAMFTGRVDALSVLFDMEQGLLLNAEGEVIDVVDLVLTGEDEFLLLCSEANKDEVFQWLSAHAGLADDAGPVFEGLELQDTSGMLAILLMFGAATDALFSDLLAAMKGVCAHIACSFGDGVYYGVPQLPAHVLIVTRDIAPQIGDIVSSCLDVEVLNFEEYRALCVKCGAWVEQLEAAAYVKPAQAGLDHLLRPSGGFVGAKALES